MNKINTKVKRWVIPSIAIAGIFPYLLTKKAIIIIVSILLIIIIKPLKHVYIGNWHYYLGKGRKKLNSAFSGKWMYFFSSKKNVRKLCKKAILDGIVCECKHSMSREGVACFYSVATDLEGQIRLLDFMLENNMIKHKKDGSLYNISFKFDLQTAKKKYGKNFKADLTLDKFVDLDTGEFLDIKIIAENTKNVLEKFVKRN